MSADASASPQQSANLTGTPSRLFRFPASFFSAQTLFILLVAIATVLPAAYILTRAAEASANIVYWDEIDTALALVLRLQAGMTPTAFLEEMFAMNNEHRMVTSRLLFAASYGLTGTLNFTFISMVGNATIIALVALLIVTADTTLRRLRITALLGLLMFQLEHYENILWSGSSIDHYQIVLLAGLVVVGLARGTRAGTLAGGLFAMLATFTLAHGILTWLIGGLMLLQDRRWTQLAGWCGLGAVTLLGFFSGFGVNSAHHFADISFAGLMTIAAYWLTLLGAVPALGYTCVAPFLGVALLGSLVVLGAQGESRREPIAFSLTLFAVLALALIAVGRAAESGGNVFSRYMVLGATAWGLTAFMLMERYASPLRPFRSLGWTLIVLVGFNVTANHTFNDKAYSWVECRDRAALRYKQYGVDGQGAFSLHPVPAHSTALLQRAESLGIYRMDPVCQPRSFPGAEPSTRILYFVEEMTVNPRAVFVGGWAAIRGKASERGSIHLVLQSPTETHVYTTVTSSRPDVAADLKEPDTHLCGFKFAFRRDRLPQGDFKVGILIASGGKAEYIMTAHRLELTGEGKALLATGD